MKYSEFIKVFKGVKDQVLPIIITTGTKWGGKKLLHNNVDKIHNHTVFSELMHWQDWDVRSVEFKNPNIIKYCDRMPWLGYGAIEVQLIDPEVGDPRFDPSKLR